MEEYKKKLVTQSAIEWIRGFEFEGSKQLCDHHKMVKDEIIKRLTALKETEKSNIKQAYYDGVTDCQSEWIETQDSLEINFAAHDYFKDNYQLDKN